MRLKIYNKWAVLTLLTLAYTLSFMDRYLMNLLLEPVKHDLQLTDTQVSLLAGVGFALLYACMAIPLGRLSDKTNRTKLVSAGIALWSLTTTTCGMVKTFGQLLVSRGAVGVGEATLSPSAYSLLSDYFPKKLLATAIGIYSSGIYFGAGLAYIAGGALLKYFEAHGVYYLPLTGRVFSWQMVYFIFGIPGLVLSVFTLLIDEPARASSPMQKGQALQFAAFIKNDGRPFILLCAASAVFNIAVYATGIWIPTFITRIHHLPVSQAGTITGAGIMILSPLGVIAGGRIADIFATRFGIAGRIRVLILFVLLFIPASLGYLFTQTTQATLYALIPYAILVSAGVATTAALTQELVPPQFKGTASAWLLFAQNIIGMSIGSTSVALLNDYVFHNAMCLAKSLAIVSFSSLVLSLILFIACQHSFLKPKTIVI